MRNEVLDFGVFHSTTQKIKRFSSIFYSSVSSRFLSLFLPFFPFIFHQEAPAGEICVFVFIRIYKKRRF